MTIPGKKPYSHGMLTIKKIASLVSILFLSLSLAAEEKQGGRYGFSLTPKTGVLYGHAEEIVYKYPGEDQYLSELLWDLKPLVYFGLGLDFGPRDPFKRHGFTADGSVKFGLPMNTGIIEDRDWGPESHNDYLTHYSRHDAVSGFTLTAELSAGFSWRLTDFLALGAYGEFTYMRYTWDAKDGYAQYAGTDIHGDYYHWSGDISKYYTSGVGIKYAQNWFILSPGISLAGRLGKYFTLRGDICYSPLIYSVNRDDHVNKRLIFWDYPALGHHVYGGGKFTFAPSDNLDLELSVFYRLIKGSRGRSYEQSADPGSFAYQSSSDSAGGGFSALDISFAVKVRVFGRD